jgi:hypothetical protein
MKHKAIMQTLGSQISDSDDVVCPQAKGDFELGMNYAMNFLHDLVNNSSS